jgi:hypothetical protein
MRVSVLWVPLALAGGVLGGLALGHEKESRPRALAPFPATSVACADTSLRADIRRMLAEECHPSAPAAAQAPVLQPSSSPTPASSEPTAQQEASHAEAMGLVERAIDSGSWSEDNATRLRELLAGLDAKQAAEVMHTFRPALNTGKIRFEGAMRPF